MHRKRIRTSEQIMAAAKELRARQTAAEALLWEALRDRRIGGMKCRRQHPIGPLVVDFYCASGGLVVEIDGAVHEGVDQQSRDAARTRALQARGLHVLRVRNEEVFRSLPAVLHRIERAAAARPSRTAPPLPPAGEGAGGEGRRGAGRPFHE